MQQQRGLLGRARATVTAVSGAASSRHVLSRVALALGCGGRKTTRVLTRTVEPLGMLPLPRLVGSAPARSGQVGGRLLLAASGGAAAVVVAPIIRWCENRILNSRG